MTELLAGRLIVDDGELLGRVVVEDGRIVRLEPDGAVDGSLIVVPGFIDVHVHGWGGHDAMGGTEALSGMARALAARGVTSFLPTSVTASFEKLTRFADSVREWLPLAPDDGAEPLGFNMEGPFLAEQKRGAHPAHLLRHPEDLDEDRLATFVEGLRVITIAPELRGAPELIERLAARGVRVSLGHSAATVAQSRRGYEAGAVTTTHLFNAMIGVLHREPGLALAALLDDAVWVELIADTLHVDPDLWPLIWRLKPAERVLLVSDAIALAGSGRDRGMLGELEVRVDGDMATLVEGGNLAGSVTALDLELRNVVRAGVALPDAVRAATANPAELLGLADRGHLAAGLRADLVELDAATFAVRRVMRHGAWIVGG
ncbi:MAG TPA: amidohydrolase family protein [Anaerolineae bacterium]|nr:amidohydrolase family protein [Anaerolineae bacterium]